MIKLTPRDLEFLEDLYKVGVLNSSRVSKLYGTYQRCMFRMKELVNSGYVRKVDRLYNGEFVYGVTGKSCKVLSLEKKLVFKSDKLMHMLACADFYFYIKSKGVENFDVEVQYYFNHKGRKYSFRPDILFQLDKWYFVEMDLCGKRFESKVVTWEKFYETGAYEQFYEKYPPIIVVSKHVNKVQRVIESMKKIDLNYVYKDYNEISDWNYKYGL